MVRPLHCFVEIPMGSHNTYEWDATLQGIRLDRFLFASVGYPTDFGFVPETSGEDGDPLGALVCVSLPTFPGCVIGVRAIGALQLSVEDRRDDKLVCVPHDDPGWSGIERPEDLPDRLRTEIEHFFSIYRETEGTDVTLEGWGSPEDGDTLLAHARERFAAASAS